MEEMQKYGLKYSLHGSSLRYSIPEELRELIINYINKNNSTVIKSKSIISKILEYFTEEKLLRDEIERLEYRKISNSIEVEYFGRGCSEDRFFRVEHKCIDDAEKLLEN